MVKPPSLTFQICLNSSTFPDDWEKYNIEQFIKRIVNK